ncbi:MAG: hypothetical protein DWQ34_14990 [Planctomycetota bacterium]|nr:MAG: hypothetical protein DWQ34_14990 [Planctomycetota bacterium]REK25574.1 MAG: hypothetical protein DWQ41_11580 [Planctomycetota bacterium]REK31714.1 MAG: hypothetical protein DWQ45_19105 [Planctomycetota bacterium]
MASRKKSGSRPQLSKDDQTAVREMLGHLNFSAGTREPVFLRHLNRLWEILPDEAKAASLAALLRDELNSLAGSSAAFADCRQANAVIGYALEELPEAYRAHHADLLFHLEDSDFEQPYLLGCFFEAVLAEGEPWDDRNRIINGALARLNDFVGYRPVAVLENGRRSEVYDHERYRPLPVYIRGAGTAAGKYHDLIEQTIAFLDEAPSDLLEQSHFRLRVLDELSVDMRAHDHMHPVNKRTNYMFGEWDPHVIDVKGDYRRFVVRKIILDSLCDWVEKDGQGARKERLFDAAAALCGTMLMAASISGSGPETHDSSVSLTSLLPVVARRRDEFYARLMRQVSGARAKRLQKEQRRTHQPFGHVRQYLNMRLASYGARQVQHHELAQLYAQMGHIDAAREQAAAIPAASIRFECELQCVMAGARLALNRSRVKEAAAQIQELEPLLKRGVACGALVDPWNFLGFQGQFPLFASREDAIPDSRIESLLELMEGVFSVFSKGVAEAAAQGEVELQEQLVSRFYRLSRWWDQFGSDIVDDLPDVSGGDSYEAAVSASRALARWREAGEAAGDISFWRQHVDQFGSAHAYVQVVQALLDKGDHVAALGLLMQWLSQIEEIGLESPEESILSLLIRWTKQLTSEDSPVKGAERARLLRRMFDSMEANAEEFWSVPTLEDSVGSSPRISSGFDEAQPTEFDEDDDGDDIFGAAYESVTYQDTADDGTWGDTLDEGQGFGNTEFEVINRELEARLKFLNAVGQMWQLSACGLAADLADRDAELDEPVQEAIAGWQRQILQWEQDLLRLMNSLWEHDVPESAGDHDSNIEYDLQLQVKFYLLNQVITTLVCLKNARRLLQGFLRKPPRGDNSEEEKAVASLYSAIIRRDAALVREQLPGFLKWIEKQPLLYVPFEHDGQPGPLLKTQSVQAVIRMLLRQLPPLGMLREGWHVLQAAYRMERRWRPEGQAITEFDRLFQISLRSVLDTVLSSARRWRSGRFSSEELIDVISELIEPYQALWLKHSHTMRLSSVDGVRSDEDWAELAGFIQEYGADLFHASQLTLGNVRAILHNGVDWLLNYFEENDDPLHPVKLVDDLRSGRLDRDDAQWCLETIYSMIVDRFDRFLDYNTTTTQSDYGDMFFCLLEFLRVESHYDRDAWHMLPLTLVHEMLTRNGWDEAAEAWAATFEVQTEDIADRHLADIAALEERYGMQMPTIRDHLNQRFVKPLAVNRMVGHVAQSVRDMQRGRRTSAAFRRLRTEIDEYLTDSWGSGVEVPSWLRMLEQEVEDSGDATDGGRPGTEAPLSLPAVRLGIRDFRQQMRKWKEPLAPSPARQDPKRPQRRGRKSTKPRSDPRPEGEA